MRKYFIVFLLTTWFAIVTGAMGFLMYTAYKTAFMNGISYAIGKMERKTRGPLLETSLETPVYPRHPGETWSVYKAHRSAR